MALWPHRLRSLSPTVGDRCELNSIQVDDEDKERISANATSKRVMEDLAKVTVVNPFCRRRAHPCVCMRTRWCAPVHSLRAGTHSIRTLSTGT